MTPMGARLLRQWLLAPLVERAAIEARLDAVEALVARCRARATRCARALDGVRDIERLGGKAALGGRRRASSRRSARRSRDCPTWSAPSRRLRRRRRDRLAARRSWDGCAELATHGAATRSSSVRRCSSARRRRSRRAWIAELDELRDAARRRQGRDRADPGRGARAHGIASLKVGYNRVFGYYIEITQREPASRARRLSAPPDADRRRALRDAGAQGVRGEGADGGRADRDARARAVRDAARARSGARSARIQCAARIVAELDVLAALADVAAREGYARPTVTDGFDLEIVGGTASRRGADDAARQVHPERRAAHGRRAAS